MIVRWSERNLGDLCLLKAGSAFPQRYQDPAATGIPFYKVSDLARAHGAPMYRLSDSARASLKPTTVPAGSILFAKIGEGLKAERFLRTNQESAFDNNLMAAVPIRSVVDECFLFYLLKTLRVSDLAVGSALPYLKQSDLMTRHCQIPGLATQTAIADVLGALDDKIAANERVIRLGEGLLQARFSEMASQPSDWVPVGQYVTLRYGKSLPTTRRRGGGVTVVGSGGPSGTHDEALVKGPGIVVGRKGSIGTVWWCEHDFWPIDTSFYVEPQAGTGLRFAHALLSWLRLDEQNGDSAVPGLNRDVALAQQVPQITDGAAREFEELATPIMKMSEGLRVLNIRLAATRDALLPELMSGRLTVDAVRDRASM